jgi:hypothetical protein
MNKRHQKYVRQRSNAYILSKQPTPSVEGKRPFDYLRDWVGLATATGIFSALLYLAGRSFASGYFRAMNIPSYQVSFSIWEYGQVAWLPLLIYPTIMFGSAGLLSLLLSAINDWLGPYIKKFKEWVWKIFNKKDTKASSNMGFSKETRRWFIVVMVSILAILSILVVDGTLYFVYKWGELSGLINVVHNSAEIEVSSESPLPLQNEVVDNQSYYLYENHQMLTFNNNKYYMFNSIDTVTCRPLEVFVVDSSNLIQVDIMKPISLDHKCSKEIPVGIYSTIVYLFFK